MLLVSYQFYYKKEIEMVKINKSCSLRSGKEKRLFVHLDLMRHNLRRRKIKNKFFLALEEI